MITGSIIITENVNIIEVCMDWVVVLLLFIY